MYHRHAPCTAQNKLFADNLEDKPILPQVASQVDYNHGHSASIDLFRKSLRPIQVGIFIGLLLGLLRLCIAFNDFVNNLKNNLHKVYVAS